MSKMDDSLHDQGFPHEALKCSRCSAVTRRPWKGRDAVTQLTQVDFYEMVHKRSTPEWASRAAVSIARAYGINKEQEFLQLLEVIEDTYREYLSWAAPEAAELTKLAVRGKTDGCEAPLWAQLAAVRVCKKFNYEGVCDYSYIANVIHNEYEG